RLQVITHQLHRLSLSIVMASFSFVNVATIRFIINQSDRTVLWIRFFLKPFEGQVQPLHYEGSNGDAVRDDEEIRDTVLVSISHDGAEKLMNSNGNIKSRLAKRHTRPETSLKLLRLIVMRVLIWEELGQIFVINTIEQSELLLDEIDVFSLLKIGLKVIWGCLHKTILEIRSGFPGSFVWRNPHTNMPIINSRWY